MISEILKRVNQVTLLIRSNSRIKKRSLSDCPGFFC